MRVLLLFLFVIGASAQTITVNLKPVPAVSTTFKIKKNGTLLGTTTITANTGWPAGSANPGDVFTVFYVASGVDTVAVSEVGGGNSATVVGFSNQTFPDATHYFKGGSGASAPPTWCADVTITNKNSVPFRYTYIYNGTDTNGASYTASSSVIAQAGVTASIHIGPVGTKQDITLAEDSRDGGLSWSTVATAGSAAWYDCASSPSSLGVLDGPSAVPLSTNLINFADPSVTTTNAATDKTLQIGFDSLAAAVQTGNEMLARLGTNVGGAAGGPFDSYLTNLARIRQIQDGGGVSTPDVNTAITDGQSKAAADTAFATHYTYLDSGVTAGESAITAVAAPSGFSTTLGEVDFPILSTSLGLKMRFFDLLNDATIAPAISWFKTAMSAFLILSFYAYCFRRSQKYLWDLLIASNVKPIAGGAITEFANRSIGYLLVAATMAAIAAVPGAVVAFLNSHGMGISTVFGAASDLNPGSAPSFVKTALDLAERFFPLDLAVTQFLTGIVFEMTTSKVCLLAMAVLRFIKVFCFVALLAGVSSYASVDFTVRNALPEVVTLRIDISGSPVNYTIPVGETLGPVVVASTYSLIGTNGSAFRSGSITDSDFDATVASARLTCVLVDVGVPPLVRGVIIESYHSPLNWFLIGAGAHTTVWLAGWSLRAYRGLGRQVISSLD
jgi:hypothetical protein